MIERGRLRLPFTAGLLGVAIVAIAVRLWFGLAVAPDLPLPGDAVVYRDMAAHIAAGDGVQLGRPGDDVPEATAEHPPGFPALLAAFDLLGVESPNGQRAGLALLGGLSVALVGWIGRATGGETVGLGAATVAALHPLWFQPAGTIMSESLLLVTAPAVMALALGLRQRRSLATVAGTGVAVGLAGLVRPESLGLVAVVVVPVLLLNEKAAGRRWRLPVVAVLASVVVVVPWVVRNDGAVGAPTLATNSGKTIMGSNCDDTYGGELLGGFSHDCFFGAATVLTRYGKPDGTRWSGRELDDEMGRLGREYIGDHLGEQPKVIGARLVRMWGLAFARAQLEFDVSEGRHEGLQRAGQWVHLGLLPFAAAGTWALVRRRDWASTVVLVGPIVLASAATLAVYGGTRLRVGAEPSIAVLAALGAAAVATGVGQRRSDGPMGRPGSLPRK